MKSNISKNSLAIISSLLLFFIFQCSIGLAVEKPERLKIGLVLSGGGARGAAHIGVIKVLEELNVPIDYIAGTSMGSIVGGLYASGMSTDEIQKVLTSIDWSEAFKDTIPREDRSFRRKKDDELYLIKSKPGLSDSGQVKLPIGLLEGQEIGLIFKRLTLPVAGITNFDNLTIPYRAVASDIVTGKTVVIGSGDLALAMRASMSIPPIFSPVEIDNKLLVDGGVSNNLPIDVVRNMGADIVIAVDISTPLLTRKEITSSIDITNQLTGLLTRNNTEAQIKTLTNDDLLIIPDMGKITTASFDLASDAVPIGAAAAMVYKDTLTKYSLADSDQASATIGQVKKLNPAPVISFIEVNNQSQISDKVLLARLAIEVGKPLDTNQLQKDIDKIFGLELFENVGYEIMEKDGETGLRLNAKERSWGPNYLQVGLAISDNLDGGNSFNLGFAYTRTGINRLAGEWRTAFQIGESPGIFTELYQPLDYGSRYFIHPRLLYAEKNINLYDNGGNVASQYLLSEYGLDIAVGREISTWGELRFGISRLAGDVELSGGQDSITESSYDKGEWYLKFSLDSLNNRYFPLEGSLGSIKYLSSHEE